MNSVVYLKEPGILYDMLFALKLRLNGERAYLPLRDCVLSYTDDEKFYNLIIGKLSDVSEKLLPLFYYDNDSDVKTAMFTYVHEYIDLTTDGLIDYFYESLRDVNRLKKVIYTNYISENCPDVFDVSTVASIKSEIFSSALPGDVKMYLLNFLLYGEDEINEVIATFRKVETLCRQYHQLNQRDIQKYTDKFGTEQIRRLSDKHSEDITHYNTIYISYCSIICDTIYSKAHDNIWFSLLGIRAGKKLCQENTGLFVNLYELGNILHDEQRLKILNMLIEEDMYCAQIASRLGLKNNSTLYHLVMMEKEGLITSQKKATDGRRIYYNINRNYLNEIKKLINTKFTGDQEYENK